MKLLSARMKRSGDGTWQESLPPSRNPAQNMLAVI